MHVNRSQSLSRSNIGGLRQSVFGKQSIAAQRSVLQPLVDLELILSFERKKNPWPGWMKIQVTALKIKPSSRGNRKPVRQQSIVVAEDFQGAGILRLRGSRSVAPSHQNHHFVRG